MAENKPERILEGTGEICTSCEHCVSPYDPIRYINPTQHVPCTQIAYENGGGAYLEVVRLPDGKHGERCDSRALKTATLTRQLPV